MEKYNEKKYTILDLFSGCGGFTEGFLQSKGFEFLAHVEWEKPMVQTLRDNLVERWGYTKKEAKEKVVRFDIQKTEELLKGNWSDDSIKKYEKDNSNLVITKGLNGVIDNKRVDIIIGGPPCQAYSLAGRAQDKNSMKDDYRNYLFESFVKIVDYYKPKIFVFENVPGILSAKPGDLYVIDRIITAFDKIGYQIRDNALMKKSIFSSYDFGVPQDRKRVIIFGVKKGSKLELEDLYRFLEKEKTNDKKTVKDAIKDLPKFKPLKKEYKEGRSKVSHKLIEGKKIKYHYPRYNNKRDINVFYEWLKNDMNNFPNRDKIEFYYKTTGRRTNHNKYRSLEWHKPSPTIVSHLYKDGLMFIHPDIKQLRTITILEASLLQSFPIDYIYSGSNAYCFKMIGNAVPVLMAKSIGNAIKKVWKV